MRVVNILDLFFLLMFVFLQQQQLEKDFVSADCRSGKNKWSRIRHPVSCRTWEELSQAREAKCECANYYVLSVLLVLIVYNILSQQARLELELQ